MHKPFSQACENNKQAILDVLTRVFSHKKQVLELGSGTGQHGVYFAEALPHLVWQCSDLLENHPGIKQWIVEKTLNNIKAPIELNVENLPWQVEEKEAIFSANTLHIMSWQNVENFFSGVAKVLAVNGVLAVYGPFNYQGEFTSESNRQFNTWLKQRALHQGIRDFEKVNALAESIGLELKEDNEMPANNRLLVWEKLRSF